MDFSIEGSRMNRALKAILVFMLNHRYFNNKHTPEKILIVVKTKWLNQHERKDFEREYKDILNQGIILRLKKRTGKGSDWHISLNSRKIKELDQFLTENDNEEI